MKTGDTFLFEDGSDDHLWMVISDTAADAERVVIVKFLSWQPHYDQSCVLDGGEHPFVKHATCVDFPGAKVPTLAQLELLERQGMLKHKAPLSARLLQQIRNAVAASDIPTKAIAALGEQGVVRYP